MSGQQVVQVRGSTTIPAGDENRPVYFLPGYFRKTFQGLDDAQAVAKLGDEKLPEGEPAEKCEFTVSANRIYQRLEWF